MAYTEFYCTSALAEFGDNRSAGSDPSGFFDIWTGATWVAATGVLTGLTSDPVADGVTVGMFASVRASGAVVTGFVGRITALDATSITVSLTAKAGTVPVDGVGNRDVWVGGMWKGPNALEDFPFGFITSTLNDGVNLVPRVNFKNSTVYAVTGAISHTPTDSGPIVFQGYTTTPGDGGRCTIQGPSTGTSFAVLTIGGSNTRRITLEDFIFDRNGATGTGVGLSFNSVMGVLRHVSVRNMRGGGISLAAGGIVAYECDAVNCNLTGTSLTAGITVGANLRVVRCYAAKNLGPGFGTGTGAGINATFINCIAERNTEHGITARTAASTTGGTIAVINCDLYANGGSGVWVDSATATFGGLVYLENTNIVLNSRYGIEVLGTSVVLMEVLNCGFGQGTYANTLGVATLSLSSLIEQDIVPYPVDYLPYVDGGDPANFILRGEGRHAGRGTNYPDIRAGSPPRRIDDGYPDIGAAPHFSPDALVARPRSRR